MKINNILNSIIIDCGYNLSHCNTNQNIFIMLGLALNQRKYYKTSWDKFSIDQYFNRFLNKNFLSISPKISLKFEKRSFFIENECLLYVSDLYYGSLPTSHFYNRLIFGIKL